MLLWQQTGERLWLGREKLRGERGGRGGRGHAGRKYRKCPIRKIRSKCNCELWARLLSGWSWKQSSDCVCCVLECLRLTVCLCSTGFRSRQSFRRYRNQDYSSGMKSEAQILNVYSFTWAQKGLLQITSKPALIYGGNEKYFLDFFSFRVKIFIEDFRFF